MTRVLIVIVLVLIGIGILYTGTLRSVSPRMHGHATDIATFGAGCFWGVEAAFRNVPGVVSTRVGYAGGHVVNPSYEDVCGGDTGHTESVEVSYDAKLVSYSALLQVFWGVHDPTVTEKTQYRSVIFYHTPAQKDDAIADKERMDRSGKYSHHIVTEILPAPPFYQAEPYHQQYYEKNGITACPTACPAPPKSTVEKIRVFSVEKNGFIEVERVAKPVSEWRNILTVEQFEVARQAGTETPFKNAYWDNHGTGIYRCVCCGNDLFTSATKFESGTGWPSFTAPVAKENVVEVTDRTLGMVRTEVKCRRCDAHLGHVFDDGPPPTGLRYCMNSASMKFVPYDKIKPVK